MSIAIVYHEDTFTRFTSVKSAKEFAEKVGGEYQGPEFPYVRASWEYKELKKEPFSDSMKDQWEGVRIAWSDNFPWVSTKHIRKMRNGNAGIKGDMYRDRSTWSDHLLLKKRVFTLVTENTEETISKDMAYEIDNFAQEYK